MKKIIFSIMLLLIAFNGFSQEPYSHYWDGTSEWRNYSGGWNGFSGYTYHSTIYFDGYEVVNGISYYKEYTNQLYETTSWSGAPISETTLYGPILTREDTAGNFYRISPNDGVEYLTFSNLDIINAQLGDVFPYVGSSCNVENITTNYIGSLALKRVKGLETCAYCGSLEGIGVVGPTCALGIEGNGWINCYTKGNVTLQFGPIDCAAFPPANRQSLGIGNNNETAKKFSIYPNPSNGIIKIRMPAALTNADYELYSINGLRIIQGSITSQEQLIDIYSFASGVYILKIKGNGSSEFFKLVKN